MTLMQATYDRLREVVGVFGTYGHLLVAPASMSNDVAFLESVIDIAGSRGIAGESARYIPEIPCLMAHRTV